MITKYVKLWIGSPQGAPPVIRLSQYDTDWKLVFTLYNGDSSYALSSEASVVMNGRKPDGRAFSVIGSAEDGNAVVQPPRSVTEASGRVECEIAFSDDGGAIGTANFYFEIERAPLSGFEASENDFSAINQLVNQAVASANSAGTAAEAVAEIKGAVSSPLTAATAEAMTNHDKVYVYTGTTTSDLTNGHWYYYDGSAWQDGGVYNAVAVNTDKTLSVADTAADAKAVGDADKALERNIDTTKISFSDPFTWENGWITANSGSSNTGSHPEYIRTDRKKASTFPTHCYVHADDGYVFTIHVYTSASGGHSGMYNGSTVINQSSSIFLRGGIVLDLPSSNYIRITMRDESSTPQTSGDTSMSEHLKFYAFTDTALTVSGSVADAKAVGDRFTTDEASIDGLKELNSSVTYKRQVAKSGNINSTATDMTYVMATDGSITLNGVANSWGQVKISGDADAIPSWVQANTDYYIEIGGADLSPKAHLQVLGYKEVVVSDQVQHEIKNTYLTRYRGPEPATFRIDDISDLSGIMFRLYLPAGTEFSNFTFTPRILSSPPNYELYPYLRDKWTWDSANKLRVMQYNIGGYKFGYKTSEVAEHKLTEPMYQRKLAGLKKLFAEYKPDVVGIQEQEPYMDKAQTHSPIDELFGPDFTFITSNTSYEVGMFARRNMTAIPSTKQEDSNRTEGYQSMHGIDDHRAIWYLAETTVGNKRVAIATGAFGYVSGNADASINNRLAEMSQVMDALDVEDENGNKVYDCAIIMGDFNSSLQCVGGTIIDPDGSLRGAEAATLAAWMTDTSKQYLYCGNEEGYTKGDLYYYSNGAWTHDRPGYYPRASTVAEMTSRSQKYVYTGSETGYVSGDLYAYVGSAWVSQGNDYVEYYMSGDEYVEDYRIESVGIGAGYSGPANSMQTMVAQAKLRGYSACQGLDTGWTPTRSYVHHHTIREKRNVSPYYTDTGKPEIGWTPRTLSCIDNIMVRGPVAIVNYEVLMDEYEQLCSDHVPVIADLYIYE